MSNAWSFHNHRTPPPPTRETPEQDLMTALQILRDIISKGGPTTRLGHREGFEHVMDLDMADRINRLLGKYD